MTSIQIFRLGVGRLSELAVIVCLLAFGQTALAFPTNAKLDFDADGKTDLAVYRKGAHNAAQSYWIYIKSSDGTTEVSTPWGLGEDYPVPGDYDNNGIADMGVFRPSLGNPYLININGNFVVNYFGVSTSFKMIGRYQSYYGATQPSELRLENVSEDPEHPDYRWFFYFQTSEMAFLAVETGDYTGGNAKQLPAPGDYNGDGFTDVGVFDYANNLFHYWASPNFNIPFTAITQNIRYPAPGDYDGDGRADIAGYYVAPDNRLLWSYRESLSQEDRLFHWGTKGDKPVPGDYDGDGKTDLAVFRPSNTTWYVLKSTTGTHFEKQFGTAQDIPLASAVLHNGF